MKKLTTVTLGITLLLASGVCTFHCYGKKKTEKTKTKGSTMTTKRIKTASGLEYEIVKDAPAGAISAQKGKKAKVHYTGWLNENGQPGKKFDSSVDRGQPFEFAVGMGFVIAGWDEMVALMQVGQKVRVYLPSKLGYGSRGAGAAIPANADLIFDIELLSI